MSLKSILTGMRANGKDTKPVTRPIGGSTCHHILFLDLG